MTRPKGVCQQHGAASMCKRFCRRFRNDFPWSSLPFMPEAPACPPPRSCGLARRPRPRAATTWRPPTLRGARRSLRPANFFVAALWNGASVVNCVICGLLSMSLSLWRVSNATWFWGNCRQNKPIYLPIKSQVPSLPLELPPPLINPLGYIGSGLGGQRKGAYNWGGVAKPLSLLE